MEKVVFETVKKALMEGIDTPYDRQEDKNVPHMGEKRKPVLTLKKLNQLKKLRNAKREELAQDSIFVPYLYGPAENPEGGDMGGGMGLGI